MSSPQKWLLKRPGNLIPVFFLSSSLVSGQLSVMTAAAVSAGCGYAVRRGYCAAAFNQAGLGWIKKHSLSLQQSLPFLIGDLANSALSAQCSTSRGALGMQLTTIGITGLRYTSIWCSYGLKLSREMTAGMGLHFWNMGTPERFLHHPGIGCALGIQLRAGDKLMIGGHVMHPLGWSAAPSYSRSQQMKVVTGISYHFFKSYTYFGEVQLIPEGKTRICHGIEVKAVETMTLSAGYHNHPVSFTGGAELKFQGWTVHFAFEYMLDRGSTPYTALNYEW